jgi:hypothetical protein
MYNLTTDNRIPNSKFPEYEVDVLIPHNSVYEHCAIHNWLIYVNSEAQLRKFVNKKKVKCTVVQALRLCTGRSAHRGSRGIALPFLDQRH